MQQQLSSHESSPNIEDGLLAPAYSMDDCLSELERCLDAALLFDSKVALEPTLQTRILQLAHHANLTAELSPFDVMST